MANPVWPPSLNTRALIESYAEDWQPDLVETPMDVGDPQRRARSSLTVYRLQVTLKLTWAEVETFRTFTESDLSKRTKRFDNFPHPRTKALLSNVRLEQLDKPTPISDGYFKIPMILEYRA